jgi:2-(1,2-epoxy-1,2-dihydrophenyl)acetyl-CoA isomerase
VADGITLNRDGAVATVVLDRPERLNALTAAMVVALRDTLASLASDPSVRVVVLTGAGRGFCAGGDVQALAGVAPPAAPLTVPLRTVMEVSELLHTMPQPTVAAVNGPCAGAGLSFACACDLRYAARSAVFSTAFLRVGSSGDHGSAWVLTRAVGPARARELLLLGPRLDADEAADLGLVHAVIDDGDLLAHVDAITASLAGAMPLALRNLKANLIDAVHLPLDKYLDREAERFEATMASDDARAAARAYLDQRQPPS